MKGCSTNQLFLRLMVSFMISGLFAGWQMNGPVTAQDSSTDALYTNDEDFDLGTLVSVNHDAPHQDQLQLDELIAPFPFINVAASGRGTVVRANTETGEIVGEYRSAPEGRGLNPSRTTVDLFGNVWTANRDEVGEIDGTPHGSAVKIGLVVGGTRVDETGSPDPEGGYLAPPFGYNTCVDRNEDGLIRTSRGLGDVLDWPDMTDGQGGTDGLVHDATDECILLYQRLRNAEQTRHVSVDADNNVWVGGYPFAQRMFYKLNGSTGAILDSFNTQDIGCGGYGGLIDGNGILWSVGGALLRYDPVARTGFCIPQYGYGLSVDTNGYIWMSLWDGGIVKIAPDGGVVAGFPKTTYPPSMLTSPLAPAEIESLMEALPQKEATVSGSSAGQAEVPGLKMSRTVTPRDRMSALSPSQESHTPSIVSSPLRDAFRAVGDFQAEGALPTFAVDPRNDAVRSVEPWTPGATIALTVEKGGSVVYSDSRAADPGGSFTFDLWDAFDLQGGEVVTVSDGTTTKTHTVMPLAWEAVDAAADTVSGRTTPGTPVYVWVHGNGDQTVAADASGHWVADFSAQTDLTYFSDGGSGQWDDDGDYTGAWWASPRFLVSPQDDWVRSWRAWTPGATISLTITEAGTVVYSDSQQANRRGDFGFELWDRFDVQRGQVVSISDGVNARTHTVEDLYADTVNVAADTVSGRADAGAAVDVWVNGNGSVTVTADGAGNWTADFSSQTDVTYLSDGGVQQVDGFGDATEVGWAAPRIQVAPEDEWVQSRVPWSPGKPVTLTIQDGGAVVYSISQVTDSHGNFNFNLWNVFDIQRGQVVTVTDGAVTKTHTVMPLYVDQVDLAADTISGRGQPGMAVDIWVHGDGGLNVTPDASGSWTADFSGQTDLTYFSDGGSAQTDADGDSTGVWWASPRFQVGPDDNWVGSWNRWTPGTTITMTIAEGGTVAYSDSQVTDTHGNFFFNLWGSFVLERGQVITVTDGTNTKTHTVTPLDVEGVNVAADLVYGRAAPGTNVEVWANGDGGFSLSADGSGGWLADFSGQTDLTYLSNGGSQQFDEDGDSTYVEWWSPRIQVVPEDEWVASWRPWTAGTTVTLTVKDGGAVVYTDTQVTDARGNFNFGLWDRFDLQRGQEVIVSDGTNIKSHTIMPLYVDQVNLLADTVSGRAEPGSSVEVWVNGDGNHVVNADDTGNWTTDFSAETDITGTSDGGSQQFDEDGDCTGVWWATPSMEVSLADQAVNTWNRWRPGTTITLTIRDAGAVVYSDTSVTDSHGNFGFALSGLFTLLPGQVVTVTDGTTTKTHTIAAVTVTDIDKAADQIRGLANPGARVLVRVGLFNMEVDRWVVADAGGNWIADFAGVYDVTGVTRIYVNEFDDDADSTFQRFGPPIAQNRGVAVTAADNNVWVASSALGTVTRLDNDGNVVKVIDTGREPTGVAVDAAGKVWATNMSSWNAVRIDPAAGSDGLGAVDLTVDLGPDAWPYNYSDMTGAVVVGSTSPQGFWTVVQDGQTAGFRWGRISWNTEPQASEPAGTAIIVEARAADTEAGLAGEAFEPVSNGVLFSMFGRFIEVRVTLKASPSGVSPVLSDIRIQPAVIPVAIDIKPGSYPNAVNCKDKKEVISVAVLTTAEFDAMTVDYTTVRFAGAKELHVDRRTGLPVKHVEDVDLDGDMDLVFHFYLRNTTLTCASTSGLLTGLTYGDIPIEGTDSILMVRR